MAAHASNSKHFYIPALIKLTPHNYYCYYLKCTIGVIIMFVYVMNGDRHDEAEG
jgi:hypothetical protein